MGNNFSNKSSENIKKQVNNNLIGFSKLFKRIKVQAGKIFILGQRLSSKNLSESLGYLQIFKEEENNIKKEMILRLNYIFDNYDFHLKFLNNLKKELISKVSIKDAFYYGILNNIKEYISKLRIIVLDCQMIDKYYGLNTSNNLIDI